MTATPVAGPVAVAAAVCGRCGRSLVAVAVDLGDTLNPPGLGPLDLDADPPAPVWLASGRADDDPRVCPEVDATGRHGGPHAPADLDHLALVGMVAATPSARRRGRLGPALVAHALTAREITRAARPDDEGNPR